MVPEALSDWGQGWILTTASSVLCVLGCGVIYYDDLYYLLFPRFITSRYGFHIKENYTFLNGSLAFSSGCLLFTSLYRLLPAAMNYLGERLDDDLLDDLASAKWRNFDLMASFVFGVALCLSFNYILHLLTSESVVHCNHGSDSALVHTKDVHKHTTRETTSDDDDESHSSDHSHSHSLSLAQSHSHSHSRDTSDETAPLVPKVVRKKSLIHYIIPAEDEAIGECKGYSSAELCLYKTNSHSNGPNSLHYCEIPELTNHPDLEAEATSSGHSHLHHHHRTNEDHSTHHDHHHHVNSPYSRLLLIGVQTILAITLHKFPEGFITYITSETNPELGVTIFISLLFHNFTEGFSMCLPLYYSFASGSSKKYAKLKAWAISATLGGLAQPLGALIGFFFLGSVPNDADNIDLDKLNFIFGITMAVTSGFLCVIGLSMYGSAVSFGGSLNFVLLWSVTGMAVIGISNILSAS
ncbi:uncharacterized protein CANTADRAFT_54642 [Suhomyces tanzawaensis NRRL Y-17324]|uniref:Zinc/iron permease n=1 Tax=Suhomyces tanzawaensis NRRL Y-17324 TaxID=984487 RepID=A0A1E4SEZ3_9ASCO|nr:uncharacterized protein CANTADRAFT_54642 [Suhomyces tanzawaensis NRRL Y-17324]ODV78091.1 hypothetical protein CANTADRAFT_54642 [Suhomyces tanzawaensis NRRL Y-17324]